MVGGKTVRTGDVLKRGIVEVLMHRSLGVLKRLEWGSVSAASGDGYEVEKVGQRSLGWRFRISIRIKRYCHITLKVKWVKFCWDAV